MRTRVKIRLAGALGRDPGPCLLLCGAATSADGGAGSSSTSQIQLGDVFSSNLLNVVDAVDGVELTTDATGNDVVARTGAGAMHFDSEQTLRGYVAATSSAYVAGRVAKPYDVLTSATGNTATAGSRDGATTGESTQVIHAGGGVLAAAYDGVDGPAGAAVIDANAVGNTQGWDTLRGRIGTTTTQSNMGVTQAKAEAEFWRADTLDLVAVAAGNNVTADGAQSSVDMAVGQVVGGEGTTALVDAHIYDVGEITGYAEASGNSIDVAADGGDPGLISNQTNNAAVLAESRLSATIPAMRSPTPTGSATPPTWSTSAPGPRWATPRSTPPT